MYLLHKTLKLHPTMNFISSETYLLKYVLFSLNTVVIKNIDEGKTKTCSVGQDGR